MSGKDQETELKMTNKYNKKVYAMSLNFFFNRYMEYQNDDFYAFIGDLHVLPDIYRNLGTVDSALEYDFYKQTNGEEEIDLKSGFGYMIKFLKRYCYDKDDDFLGTFFVLKNNGWYEGYEPTPEELEKLRLALEDGKQFIEDNKDYVPE